MLETYGRMNAVAQAAPARSLQPLACDTSRKYQLVALLLSDDVGQERSVLGLRRYLPLYQQLQGESGLKAWQPRLASPFVLRACLGESIEVQVTSFLPHTPLCLALVGDDYGILEAGGSRDIAYGESQTQIWHCRHAGTYPIYNSACRDTLEKRNLLGVLIIE